MNAHGAVASKSLGDSLVEAVLRDWRTAPLDERMRLTLGFLEKLTLLPGDVGPDDVEPLRKAGISDDAIEDAAFVCVLFSTYVRLADTFEFDIPPRQGFEASAKSLLTVGYAFPPPLRWLIERRRG